MRTFTSKLLIVYFAANFFAFVNCCCPYFQSAYFREQKLPMLNNSAGCSAGFDDLSVSYSGDQWCNLFASRAMCKLRCMYDCKLDKVYSVTCPKIDCGPDGSSTSSIKIQCYCSGRKNDGSGSINCNTAVITWAEVEHYHMMLCQQGKTIVDVLDAPTEPRFKNEIDTNTYDNVDNNVTIVPVLSSIAEERSVSLDNSNSYTENKNVNIRNKDIVLVDASGSNSSLDLGSIFNMLMNKAYYGYPDN